MMATDKLPIIPLKFGYFLFVFCLKKKKKAGQRGILQASIFINVILYRKQIYDIIFVTYVFLRFFEPF